MPKFKSNTDRHGGSISALLASNEAAMQASRLALESSRKALDENKRAFEAMRLVIAELKGMIQMLGGGVGAKLERGTKDVDRSSTDIGKQGGSEGRKKRKRSSYQPSDGNAPSSGGDVPRRRGNQQIAGVVIMRKP